MEITVANEYPKRRNCRKNAPLNTPKHAANTMVAMPPQFDDRGQKFEQPQVRKSQASDTSIARPEEHVLVLKSGVKFAVFLQLVPKTDIFSNTLYSSYWHVTKVASSF